MLALTYYLIPSLLLVQYAVGSSVHFNQLLIPLRSCPVDAEEPWSYRGRNGPMFWGENYTDCNMREQSPIDINTRLVQLDRNLGELNISNYDMPVTSANIVNNGHTIQLTPTDNEQRSITIGDSTYTLQQLHFHWGDKNSRGAEHTLDGVQHTMEMHLVHMNEDSEIAVVGVIFQRGTANSGLQNIVNSLWRVKFKDMETRLTDSFNLNDMLPKNTTYYRYAGSLTTPGCAEGVTWSVLTDILTVGQFQMLEFRKLFSAPRRRPFVSCTLSNNYRPVQPLNDRRVFVSQMTQ